MEKKRILVVSQHYWPENFRITDICAGFAAHGVEVDVLCGLPNYPSGSWYWGYSYRGPRRETHGGAEIFRAGEIPRERNTSGRIFLNYVFFPVAALCNLPRLHGRHYDAVLCYQTSPVLMMLPAIVYAKLHRVPLTTYVLDLWPENLYSVLPVKNRALRAIASGVSHWLYRRSDRLVAMSDALSQRLAAIAPRARRTVIPQYCEDFYAQELHIGRIEAQMAGRFCVLFAGNISPAQDLRLLLPCARRLKKAHRTDILFVIVGEGMSRMPLEAQVAAEDLFDQFLFTGQCAPEEVPAWQTAADVLFAALVDSPGVGMTVPAKIASYLAAAKPCLIAMNGEAARIVSEAGAGLVSRAGDEDALYENLLRLADMPAAQRAQMGEAARRCYEANFCRTPLLQKLETFVLSGDDREVDS